MAHPHNSGSAVRIFFEILHNERGQWVNENKCQDFPHIILVWGKWTIFGPKNGASS